MVVNEFEMFHLHYELMYHVMLRKHGENMAEVRTPAKSTQVDNIRAIYGPAIARLVG